MKKPQIIILLSTIFILMSCNKRHYIDFHTAPVLTGSINQESGHYKDGEKLTVEATPIPGWRFKSWEITGLSPSGLDENPFELIVNEDMDITAIFQESTMDLDLTDYNDEVFPVGLTFEGFNDERRFFSRWDDNSLCPWRDPYNPMGIYGDFDWNSCPLNEENEGRIGDVGIDPMNPRNLINRNVPISFRMKIQNERSDGSSVISALATISTSSPGVTILDNSSGVNNIPYNGSSWTTNDFKIIVEYPDEDGTIVFDLSVEEFGESFVTKNIVIPFELFEIQSISVDDDDNPDSDGNNNGICESGERIESFITLSNRINGTIHKVYGLLESPTDLINVKDYWNGVNNQVDALVWYNYNFDIVEEVSPNQESIKPRFDFVFDYNLPTSDEFSLDLIISGKVPVMGRKVRMRQKLEVKYNQ